MSNKNPQEQGISWSLANANDCIGRLVSGSADGSRASSRLSYLGSFRNPAEVI